LFHIRSLKVLDKHGTDAYSVITCRIPRWKTKCFEEHMEYLKNMAWAEARFEYLAVCEDIIPQPA